MDSVLVTSGVTLVGILVGYLGGVQKGKADLRVERERTQQLREERAEGHMQQRIAAYRDFLNSCSDMVRVYTAGGARTPLIDTKLTEIEMRLNEVLAIGATTTHGPGGRMLTTLRGYDFGSGNLDELNAARAEFLAAAHADVGPAALS